MCVYCYRRALISILFSVEISSENNEMKLEIMEYYIRNYSANYFVNQCAIKRKLIKKIKTFLMVIKNNINLKVYKYHIPLNAFPFVDVYSTTINGEDVRTIMKNLDKSLFFLCWFAHFRTNKTLIITTKLRIHFPHP